VVFRFNADYWIDCCLDSREFWPCADDLDAFDDLEHPFRSLEDVVEYLRKLS